MFQSPPTRNGLSLSLFSNFNNTATECKLSTAMHSLPRAQPDVPPSGTLHWNGLASKSTHQSWPFWFWSCRTEQKNHSNNQSLQLNQNLTQPDFMTTYRLYWIVMSGCEAIWAFTLTQLGADAKYLRRFPTLSRQQFSANRGTTFCTWVTYWHCGWTASGGCIFCPAGNGCAQVSMDEKCMLHDISNLRKHM